MENKKLVSILIPTRNRVAYLKSSIKSILKTLDNTEGVEILFRVDDDDENTINAIKSLPFDNLYINNEKMDYEKNIFFDKLIDMNFIIAPRGKGYQMCHEYFYELFKIAKGKWLFTGSDDIEILSKGWYEEIERIDALNKVCIIQTNTWNIFFIHRKMPEMWGFMSPVLPLDNWYKEVGEDLNIAEPSNIETAHIRASSGQTSEERDSYWKDVFSYPKEKYTEIYKKDVQLLKDYIDEKREERNPEFSSKLDDFFKNLSTTELNTNTNIVVNKIKDTINVNFINGPKVEILGTTNTEYTIEFIDIDKDEIVHKDIITPNHWTKANREWYTNWHIKVYDDDLIYEHVYNAEDKRVYVHFASESIGDTLAWFPYVEEFRKKHKCKMICSTFFNDLFKSKYPDIEFVNPGTTVYDLYAMYEVGIYDDNLHKNKKEHKTVPLQQISSDMLGLEFKEIRPNIEIKNETKIPGKYVVIATESTAQCKLWNYKGGWQKVVDYLNNAGYKVIVVQKEKTDLKNVIHKIGNKSLDIAIDIINGAEFFIGISSGLSWISWALQKKTILISGFTSPWYEFHENCYRINNIHSCKGCWHEHTFNKSRWDWCPMKKNFECSSTILPEVVFFQIENVINDLDVIYTNKSKDVPINLTQSGIGFKWRDLRFFDYDGMYHEIFIDRVYDFNKCRVSENDVVLDIGANIGIFTRYARANKAKEIYAFEPIKENYDIFLKNNSTESVIPYNYGISDKHAVEIFHIDSCSGGHTILDIDVNNTRTHEIREIECFSLDYMFENKLIPEKIDFMKMDAEGAEVKILQGISDENLLKINKIAMEWHEFLFNDKNILNSVVHRFSKLGFSTYVDYLGNNCMTLYAWKP